MTWKNLALCAALGVASMAGSVFADEPQPIRDFIRHAQYSDAKISPDGRFLALTVQQGKVMVLAVLRMEDLKVIRITRLTDDESAYRFYWVGPQRLMYNSAKNFGTYASPFLTGAWYAMDADGGRARTLVQYNANTLDGRNKTVHFNESYDMLDPLPDDETQALMLVVDDSDNGRNSVVSVDTMTGRRKVLARAPRDNCDLILDPKHQPRFANCSDTLGSNGHYEEHDELYRRNDDDTWTLVSKSQDRRRLNVIGTAPDGRIYALADDHKGPSAFGVLDPISNSFKVLYQDAAASPSNFIVASDASTILGVVTEAGAPHVEIVDGTHPDTAVYAALAKAFPGKLVDFTSATRDGRKIVVSVRSDTDPGQLYLFDRDSGDVRFLMQNRPELDPARMAEVRPFSFKTRDGLTVYGYMTMPKGHSTGLPTIINPHGGPIGVRDDWGFNWESQLLASRGYLVVQVNYRGSGGYGQAFRDGGHGEWGEKMQDDLTDATRWVIEQGYADPKRICIYGGSYGGYASLMGVAKEPSLYRCAVGYVGVYDLEMMYHEGDIPARESGRRYLRRTIGTDPAELQRRSPARLADRITVPVFLADGLKDVRAPHQQTDAMRSALKKAGHPAEVVIEEPAEMHGYYDEDANLNLYTKMLAFFDKYIGPNASAAGSH
jgi:dipeptidyl aminopeptidase/acylaminoacyl peptidase